MTLQPVLRGLISGWMPLPWWCSPPTCPDTDFSVDFDIDNNGDLPFSGNLEVSFYSGDPTVGGAVFLNTETVSLSGFNPGNSVSLSLAGDRHGK